MEKKTTETPKGRITYWTSRHPDDGNGKDTWLVFLPGLSADHRLFEKQTEHFSQSMNCLVWDPPAHGESRPFELDFTLDSLAENLHQILEKEEIVSCILVGQSFGGYVAQRFMSRFRGITCGFVSIDSAPLDRRYYTNAELWLLRHTYWFYMCFPWKLLIKSGSWSCAETQYGRGLMKTMMQSYGKQEYCRLADRGYRILSDVLSEETLEPECPVLLICGEKDRQITNIYNRKWASGTNVPIEWIKDAGHNANTDCPEAVNLLIETFMAKIQAH